MMKKLGLTLYMIAGAGLILSGFATQEKGLKENNRQVLEKVEDDITELGDMGFKGYCPLDYKIAFSNGEKDMLVDCTGGDGVFDAAGKNGGEKVTYDISERSAAFEGLVGSVYQDGDEFQVVVPDYDIWLSLETMNDQALSAVIWHEGFHAYQNTHHHIAENVSSEILGETELAERVDGDAKLKQLFTKELEVLGKVTAKSEETENEEIVENAENTSDAREIALEYISVKNERDALLDEAVKASEDFYDMMEGTAFYVESHAVRYENGDAAYQKNYLDVASRYVDGGAKYYRRGMLECMLLDELDPEWKTSYEFDRPLDEVIAELVAE